MELRIHPKMKWEGYSNWPPLWRGSLGRGDVLPAGEEGVLRSVAIRKEDDTMPIHLELTIEHLGNTVSGILCCDDAAIIPRLHEVLRKCFGQSIHEIGDLDIDL